MATLIRTLMLVQLDWALGSAMAAVLLASSIVLLVLTTLAGGRVRTA